MFIQSKFGASDDEGIKEGADYDVRSKDGADDEVGIKDKVRTKEGRVSRWCKRGRGNERRIMRCREGQTSSTQKCSIFVTVNWMDIIKEV